MLSILSPPGSLSREPTYHPHLDAAAVKEPQALESPASTQLHFACHSPPALRAAGQLREPSVRTTGKESVLPDH